MKKRLLSLLCVFTLLVSVFAFADTTEKTKASKLTDGTYDVPVYLKNMVKDEHFMGNIGLKQMARVVVKDGKPEFKIYSSKMKLGKAYGQFTNFFIYEDKDKNGQDAKRVEAKKMKEENAGKNERANDAPYDTSFNFSRPVTGEEKIVVAMWIDAMDQIEGGEPGSNEVKAVLVFDWAKAVELTKDVDKKDQDDQKKDDKKVVDKPQTTKYENTTYTIPVYLKKSNEDKPSMGDVALAKSAQVTVNDGKATYQILMSKMPFSGTEGSVTKLIIYADSNDQEGAVANRKAVNIGKNKIGEKEFAYDTEFSFTRPELAEKKIPVAVAVDLMQNDKSHENLTKAVLVFDWDKAVKYTKPATETPTTEQPTKPAVTPPVDLASDNWAYPAVMFVLEKGYFAGIGDNKFAPDMKITRSQFVTVLSRIAKIDPNQYKDIKFTDVPADTWYTEAVNWAQANNLVHLEDETKFEPEKVLTREEMAYILDKFITLTKLELKDVEVKQFSDQDKISDWAKDSVEAIAKKGVVVGYQGKFDAKGSFTRAQVAQVLYQIYK